MSERLSIPGSASVRSQLGIVAEDPRVFRPYAVEELSRAAEIIARDQTISDHVRRLIPIGVVYDLRPAHLMPRVEMMAVRLGCSVRRIRRDLIAWEVVDPIDRFEIARRACGMILAWRGQSLY